MNQVKETLTGFGIGIIIYAVVVEIIGIFFSENILFYTLGLFFGTVIAVILILHMVKTLDKALDLSQVQASKYMRKQSFFRLFIMLAALSAGMLVPFFNFIAVLLGLLGLKIGALLAPGFLKWLYPDRYITDTGEVAGKEVEDSK